TATSWELPSSATHWFPRSDSDRLKDVNNYLPWSIRMLSSFNTCGLKGVVEGKETEADATDEAVWQKKDASALNNLMGCIAPEL
ncbi:hypothetical protein R3P38DRAFT_2398503, partial [Favolaschia claudopus]